jgi:periplasmic protein CpxP/Spy
MIKKIALSGLLLSFLSVSLFAQQTATPTAPAQTGTRMGKNRSMSQHQMGDPATRAKKMTDRMTQQLGLDQATSQKVYDATLARAQKIDAIQASSDANKAKAQAMKANADEFKASMKGILTPDQYAKFESMKGHRKGRGGADGDKAGKDQK